MEWMVIACIRLIDHHHHIAYHNLYSTSMIITSLVYRKVTPCTIGRDDVLCDDDKEIVMMMMTDDDDDDDDDE
jgi:hypothetical protein